MIRLLPLAALLLAGCATTATGPRDARALHDSALVLDAHLDTPSFFDVPGWSIARRHTVESDTSQVDLPRMADGGLDGGFWVIYTPSGPVTAEGYAAARAHKERRADAIHRVVRENAGALQIATSADDAEAIRRAGRRSVYISIENSLGLGADEGAMRDALRHFHERGVRMASPVHARNNQLSDSTTDEARWNGLSPLGRAWVAECNRLGIMVDGSHASDAAIDQMIAVSTTPIILSHHGSRTIHDHPRNTTDERLRRVAASGGLIMANSIFLAPRGTNADRSRLSAELGRTPAGSRREEIARQIYAINRTDPVEKADFEGYMRQLLHLLQLVGVDHVGLGADWDGGGGVPGMEDVAALPRVTERLVAAGYSDDDIRKILGGNLVRLMRTVEAARTRT